MHIFEGYGAFKPFLNNEISILRNMQPVKGNRYTLKRGNSVRIVLLPSKKGSIQ